MHIAALRLLLLATLCATSVACGSVDKSVGTDATSEELGRLVQRSFGSMVPGRIRREPGLSASQRSLSASQERSALPVPTYEYAIEFGQGTRVLVASESADYAEGMCVRVLRNASSKPTRIVGPVPCPK